ncbi:MAG TPA: hypothetical protein VIL20_08025 [Sandaracinaceae bacterium]
MSDDIGELGRGLRSEELRAALVDALAGRPSRLGDLLARHGGLPGPKPNLALAAAFGEAVAGAGKSARALLETLRTDPADAQSARVFLPIAAAYGYAARLGSDPRDAWTGILELTADDRAPVRIALVAALSAWSARGAGNVDRLIAEAGAWLELADREHAYASQAIVLDVVADRRGLEGLQDPPALLDWLSRVLGAIASAPRSAERSAARRKLLAALPGALAETAASLRGAHDGIAWLTERAAEAHPVDLHRAMERTIEELRRGARAQRTEVIEALHAALATTVKPPRDPTLIRDKARRRGSKAKRRSR